MLHKFALSITLLGGLLRLYHYTTLSLWFDEGVSIYLARLPWATILGEIDHYDTHPPLHPAALKLLSLILPELTAARLLSVVAGTLTIPVVYALAQRLLGKPAAVVAGGVLAVAPLHVWYSQEARPYVLAAFFVGLSYLGLVAFHQTLARRWALLYGLATLLALYTDYSALYALAPQALLFAYGTMIHRRRALPLWGAAVVAGLGFLPWGVKMVTTVTTMGLERAPALGITPERLWLTGVSMAGAGGYYRYFLGRLPTPWEQWPAWQWAMALGLLLVALIGAWAVLRHSTLAALAVGGLFLGTLLVGGAISLYRPGFAERTVLAAVLGWALLVGAIAGARLPLIPRLVGTVSAIFVLLLSGLSLAAIYAGAEKDHWRDLAIDTAQIAKWGRPIVTYHVGVPVLLETYAGHLLDSGHLNVGQFQDLPPLAQAGALTDDAVWLVSIDLPGIEKVRDQLGQQGYTRVLHNSYSDYSLNPIYIDLYARTPADFLRAIPVNGIFAGDPGSATGWDLPAGNAGLNPDANGSRVLTLTNPALTESRAARVVPARPQGLYVMTFEARARLQAGRMRSFLLCTAADGALSRVAPDGAGADIPNDGAWHAVSISAMCPAGTVSVVLDLRNAGQGSISFRSLALWEAAARAVGP